MGKKLLFSTQIFKNNILDKITFYIWQYRDTVVFLSYRENLIPAHAYSQNIRFIHAGAMPEHRITTPRTGNNCTSYCNSRFSNIDGDKEQNLWNAALKM